MTVSANELINIANTLYIRKFGKKMYDYQERVFLTKDKNRIFNKSRQMGLSEVFSTQHLLDSIFNNTTEVIISPSQRQSNHLLDYAYGWLNSLREDFKIITEKESQTMIQFKAGGFFYSLPNSPDTVRGIRANHITLDEFAHFKNGTDKEMVKAILPSTSRGGALTYNSTPNGDKNEYYLMWKNPISMEKILLNYRQCPDFLPEKIQEQRQIIGEDAFLQEFENTFLSDLEGQEFPMELITKCIDPELEYGNLEKNKVYLGGADIGREHDLTAFVALERQGNDYILRNKNVMRQMPYNDQLNFFNYILSNYSFNNFLIDESGIGNMIAEEIARNHIIERITFNNENKQELVGNLKKIMQDGRLKIVDDPQLINSIRSIRRIYTSTNYLRFDSNRDGEIGHADLFWALALAVKENQTSTKMFRLG